MKTILFFIMVNIISCLTAQELKPNNHYNLAQKELIKRGYGMFIHFGLNTFAELEWSDGSIPVDTYNPTKLNCDQWVKVASEAGFRYVLLITKHHDGFCLWDSKYTDYDVMASPVKRDIVKEVSDACKKYGLQFAIYYSLWDRHEKSYKSKNFNDYITYMSNQLKELLTNYGSICEVWFDGGWDKPVKDWQLPKIYSMIKKIQPKCAVGVNHTISYPDDLRKSVLPDSMVIDNKYTFQYFPSDFRLWDPKIAHKLDKKRYLYQGESYYLPFEHTLCISKAWTWFQKEKNLPVRSLDELEELFYWCTDNNNTLVINIPPDKTGNIREYEANAIMELAKRIGIKKDKPLPKNGELLSLNSEVVPSSVFQENIQLYGGKYATDGGMQTLWRAADTIATLTIMLPQKPFNKISIFEACEQHVAPDGFTTERLNRIQEYNIEILENNQWKCIYVSDELMGDCKVIHFPKSYQTSKLRLNITRSIAPPAIYEINVIHKDKCSLGY